ncbi:MAG: hypothetical protein AAF615_04055 [Pseudomonadota bacterium]
MTGPPAVGITILGDSHAEMFEPLGTGDYQLASGARVDANVVAIKGATIKGLRRARSTLDVRAKSLDAIRPSDAAIVFAYGQVDLEFGYYFRRYFKGDRQPFDAFAEDLATGYADRLAGLDLPGMTIVKGVDLSVLTWSRRRAISATMKVIADGANEADWVNVHKALTDEFPTAREMDRRHRHFNSVLAEACASRNIAYFDLLQHLAGPITGRMRLAFVPFSDNHHARRTTKLVKIATQTILGVLSERLPREATDGNEG